LVTKLRRIILRYYNSIVNSIAFYPSIISVGFLMLAILLITIDNDQVLKFLREYLPFLLVNNADTARTILSTIIGGVISLTVFSFSMVMITLNQASSNFSPRLLPGLISEKKNQIVLGFYIGTIIFNILVLISILPSGNSYNLNVLSVITGIILGIACLGFFIYFIQNISSSIQIDNLLLEVYKKSKNALLEEIKATEENSDTRDPDHSSWNIINSQEAGYFQNNIDDSWDQLVEKYNRPIFILLHKGQFAQKHTEIISYKGAVNKELEEELQNLCYFNDIHTLYQHYTKGFNQLTEIGLRAMSPGINDPATATTTLNYLSTLFQLRMQIPDYKLSFSENSSVYLKEQNKSFEILFYNVFAQYRAYCKENVILMQKILETYKYLLSQSAFETSYLDVIKDEIKALKNDAEISFKNKIDFDYFIGQDKV